jgi:hypothetical protein
MALSLISREKNHSPSADEVMTFVRDREGVILMAAVPRGETDQLRRLYQDADRTQEAFQASFASQ